MFASIRSFVFLSLFLELCLAGYAGNRPSLGSTSTTSKYGSQSSSNKYGYSTCSVTKTSTISITSTSTVTPKTTITPPVVITTVVKSTTTTVLPNPPTVTFTSTSSVSTTSTVTASTSISTSISTVTTVVTSTTTTTFPVPPGFTPAADTIPGVVSVDPAQKKRRQQHAPEEDLHNIKARGKATQEHSSATCIVEVYTTTTLTITLSHTSTITAPTSISTTTSTQTSITTLPPVSTTITVSSTSTIITTVTPSTTITVSTTSTSTVFATQTSYPACANNNIIGTVNGVGIDSATVVPLLVGTTDTTKFDCCVTCLTNPACSAYIFSSNPSVLTPPACQVIIPTTCTGFGQYNEEVNLEPSGQGAGPDQGLFVGNGYCGSFDSIFTAGAGGGTVGPGPG